MSLLVVERVSEIVWMGIVAVRCVVVLVLVGRVEVGGGLLIQQSLIISCLHLLVDHLLIPHFLLAHLLAHFLLQVGDLLLESLLHLLFDNSPDQWSQMNWHCLKVLELVLLSHVVGLSFLNGYLLLLRCGSDLGPILWLDGYFLLLSGDNFLFILG